VTLTFTVADKPLGATNVALASFEAVVKAELGQLVPGRIVHERGRTPVRAVPDWS
jgi:hypothetical protein